MPTTMGSGQARGKDAYEVGKEAAREALAGTGAQHLALVVVFIWPEYDLPSVVRGIRDVTGDAPLIGCTTCGEFTQAGAADGTVVVAAIASDEMDVRVTVGRGLREANMPSLAQEATSEFAGPSEASLRRGWQGRTLFLLTDGLAGRAEEVLDELMLATGMRYQLFGGAAADNAKFAKTHVICNDEVVSDAFVCAEVLTPKPFAIALGHGWRAASKPLRVTRAEGAVLHDLNGRPAWGAYEEFAREQGIAIPADQESSFLMRHIIGVEEAEQVKLRVPLFKNEDGSLHCAAEVPEGSVVRIMVCDEAAVLDGGRSAVEVARAGLGGAPIAGTLAFECAATRINLGERFADEVRATASTLRPTALAGCASFGQLMRVRGRFVGLMDATSLVCLIPE